MNDFFLSIVVTGRNDGYGGDFTARFIRALRFNHEHLRDAGVDHEVVLVEWAPPADKPLLTDVVAEAYPASTEGWLQTWVVDPRYHRACGLDPQLAYLEFLAKNVGLRRAAGTFILSTNTDVYLGRAVIEVLSRQALEPAVGYTFHMAMPTPALYRLSHDGLRWRITGGHGFAPIDEGNA